MNGMYGNTSFHHAGIMPSATEEVLRLRKEVSNQTFMKEKIQILIPYSDSQYLFSFV